MRLRAIDLPRRDSFVLVLDDVGDDDMAALIAREAQVALDAHVREIGGDGCLVFGPRVVLDEEMTPSGLPQIRVAVEEAVLAANGGTVDWDEPEERP